MKAKEDYGKYIVLFEKLVCLLLAWYATFVSSIRSRRRTGRGMGEGQLAQMAQEPTSATDASSWTSSSISSNNNNSKDIDLTGIWIKDRKNSDSLAGLCKLANVNFLLRKAICLVRGSELKQTSEGLSIRVFSEIPWFSLNEWYEFKANSLNKRRDLRRGKMDCTMEKTKTGLKFFMEWPEPWGGYESTHYILKDEHTLQVKTDCTIRGKSISYQTLYHRRH